MRTQDRAACAHCGVENFNTPLAHNAGRAACLHFPICGDFDYVDFPAVPAMWEAGAFGPYYVFSLAPYKIRRFVGGARFLYELYRPDSYTAANPSSPSASRWGRCERSALRLEMGPPPTAAYPITKFGYCDKIGPPPLCARMLVQIPRFLRNRALRGNLDNRHGKPYMRDVHAYRHLSYNLIRVGRNISSSI